MLHTTPYSESSVVVKVFTRQLGLRSYIIKGVRGRGGRVKQNLLQPLSSLDMVVYDNPRTELNYIKELSPRHSDTLALSSNQAISHLPISFLLTVARHLGIEPLDNYSSREPLFDLQEGRFVSAPTETTLSPDLSALLHQYLSSFHSLSLPLTPFHSSLDDRTALINALLNYYHLHLSGFSHFHSHEILHTILK